MVGITRNLMKNQRKLERYVAQIKKHNKANRDSVILVTGTEGSGKSHFAIMLAHMLDRGFLISRIIFYDVKDFWNQVNDPTWYKVILCDEAADFLTSQDWMRTEAKAVVMEFKFCRYKRKFFILCIPSKEDTHFYIRDHRAKFWIYVHESRGKADLHISHKSKWKRNLYWEELGTVGFPALPTDIEEIYDQKKKDEKRKVEENPLEFSANHIYKLLREGLLDGHNFKEKTQAKAYAYLVLENQFPYSKIPGEKLTVAINSWWGGRHG